jgi:hypothetical protein
MYEVTTLHNPFSGKKKEEIEATLKSGIYPHIKEEDVKRFYNEELIEVVNKMMSVCLLYFI